jgi:phosphatidylserine/phosphatidylglycerophosphate/cardiolipin synthase-like enzyme
LVALLVVAPVVPGVAAAPSTTGPSPAVVGLYPDPVADGDPGEFVVLEVPAGTDLGRYALTDGEATVELPNRTIGGRVVLSADPARARNLTDGTVLEMDLPGLANGGERVALLREGRTVSAARYREATEGAVYRRADGGWRWRPLGATSFRPFRAERVSADLFVLPDAPGPVMRTVRSADRRLLIGGYTLSSEAVADALVEAHRRGVRVRVLLEGKPVGRRSAREAAVLDRLARAGIEVRVMAGPATRYDYHHAKYAVADDRALVMTENWKPAGAGGHSSRGWGAVVRDRAVADRLARVFRADAGGRDAVAWSRFRQGRRFEDRLAANGSYPTRFEPEPVRLEAVRLLVTPDNGGRAVRGLLANATDRVRVQQVNLGGQGPFTRALIRAARRGVEVRVLLSGAWYVREENRRLADRLNRLADSEDIPLTVRLVEPGDRFEKIHTKGAVIDGERVLLGSLNWNGHAARNNRETMLVLEGEAAASYYGAVFAADWAGGGAGGGAGLPLPPGVIAALGVAALGALAVGRRLEFD